MVFNQHPRGTLLLLFVASFSIFVSPGFSRSVLNEELDSRVISCYKNNGYTPMVGDTPHTFDCNTIVTCVPAPNGGVSYIFQPCQAGHDGEPLFYDFRNCMCVEKELAQCYDFQSEEDYNDRFHCAVELITTN